MSQITKWFLLNDLDINSTETTVVSGQMITASSPSLMPRPQRSGSDYPFFREIDKGG